MSFGLPEKNQKNRRLRRRITSTLCCSSFRFLERSRYFGLPLPDYSLFEHTQDLGLPLANYRLPLENFSLLERTQDFGLPLANFSLPYRLFSQDFDLPLANFSLPEKRCFAVQVKRNL